MDWKSISGDWYDWTRSLQPESPWRHDYAHALVMKLFLCRRDGAGRVARVHLTFQQALDVLEKVDALTPGIPKIAYLVGWQFQGHDSKYPSWDEVNASLKRPEDTTARESLRWLIREARAHQTTVSLHLNMLDAYEDSPLWQEYVQKDVIAKDRKGDLIPGEIFDGMQSYQISYAREWECGLAQRRILSLLEMLPELKEGGTIHIDAFHSLRASGPSEPISPYLGITTAEEIAAQRKVFRLFRREGLDVTSEAGMYWLREDPFIGLQPMAWHFDIESFYERDWVGKPSNFNGLPANLYCGKPFDSEQLILADPIRLVGFADQVAKHFPSASLPSSGSPAPQ